MKQPEYAALVAEGTRQFRSEVLPIEMEEIRARRRARAVSLGLAPPTDEAGGPESDLFGIALSGGGIRAATFSLGVLQALQRNGLLEHADYLSTVSGGGFTGTCLTSLMRRSGDQSSASPTGCPPRGASAAGRRTRRWRSAFARRTPTICPSSSGCSSASTGRRAWAISSAS